MTRVLNEGAKGEERKARHHDHIESASDIRRHSMAERKKKKRKMMRVMKKRKRTRAKENTIQLQEGRRMP